MPLNLEGIPADVRDRLTKTGQGFSSPDSLEQAYLTLSGLEKFRAELEQYGGFTAADETELVDARDHHLIAGVDRDEAIAKRKSTNQTLLEAQFDGKEKRSRARMILMNGRSRLLRQGKREAVRAIDAAIDTTTSAGSDPDALRRQLGVLAAVITDNADVAGAIPNAEALATELTTAAATIQAAHAVKPVGGGTPTETAALDLVDGLIVELCRAARRAARAAARALGRPEIAKAFELKALYKKTRRAQTETETDPAPTPV